jgi:hypothetical protein
MDQELRQLSGGLERLEAAKESHQRELELKNYKILELTNALKTTAERANRQSAAIARLEKQLDLQNRSLEERFNETAMLVNMLEGQKASYSPALESAQAAKSELEKERVKASALHARGRLRIRDKFATRKNRKRFVKLIQNSGYFDANWYLQSYEDVGSHPVFSKKPALHYLLHGGYEGRNPGPEFNSITYYQRHPEVLVEGINPLLHYLLHGEAEGRDI